MIYEDHIDKFLRNEMSDQERTQFKRRLSMDRELQMMYRLTKDVSLAVAEKDVLLLRKQLDVIHDEIYKPVKVLAYSVRQTMKVAAVIAGIIFAVSIVFVSNKRHLENTDIYNKYFEPYESTVRIRSANYSGNLILTAMYYYDHQNYKEAAKIFEQILATDSTRMSLNLYSGISNMEIKEYQKADRSFNYIINSNNNPYVEQAEWYLGFCYLMTGEQDKACTQFEAIANSESYYNRKAQKITRKIKRMED